MKKNLLFLLGLATLTASGQPYFQQEVHYTIDVTLNDEDHTLSGFESFEYINHSGLAIDFIYVHLWANGYKNNKTALAKQLYNMNDMSLEFATEEEKGWIDSLDFKVDGQAVKWEYDPEHIDICKIYLNSVLQNNQKITVTTPFKVKIPSGDISRLGHVGESYQITQWYPKPAVFDRDGWHPMPYLTQGEFYSEFGSFDVSITLPANYVVGATGDLQTESETAWLEERVKSTREKYDKGLFKDRKTLAGGDTDFPESSEEMKTIRFTQKDVHDFAWFADKRFEVLKGEVELPQSGRKVTTWAMFVTHHHQLWEDALEYLHDGTYYYSLWNGDYPYNNVTAVDGTISAGGGMEYPNITVIGNASSKEELEVVIVHEVGHNWFYGILGSNERDHGWMDEGLNTLNEMRYIYTKYPKNDWLSDMMMGMAEKINLEHLDHHDMNDMTYNMSAGYGVDQPMELHSADYSMINYGAIVYSKTGLVFTFLKDYLGDTLFDQCMRAYFEAWKFKHPQPEDLRAVIEKESGKDLSWLFDDIVPTTAQIDYAIKRVKEDETGYSVTIKNSGHVDCPVRVDGYFSGKILQTRWAEPGAKKTTLHFEGSNFDKFKIDGNLMMPEVNRNNNMWKSKGLLHKVEPVKFEFLFGDNDPNYSNGWFTPIVGVNEYDKFMVGVLFHNQTIPKNNFEYTLAPMFSVGRKNIAGFGDLSYSWVPEKNFRMIAIGLNVRTFGNGLGIPADSTTAPRGTYYAFTPYVDMKIGKPAARSFGKQHLVLKGHYVIENGDLYENLVTGASAVYQYTYKKRVHNFGAALRLDYYNISTSILSSNDQSDLMNGSLELKYNLLYWKKKKEHVEVRAFFGQNLFYNGVQNVRYGFALGGQSGYMDAFYEHYMFGRHEPEGLWSNQRIENQGGFKTVAGPGNGASTYGASTTMVGSANFYIDIPYVPLIGLFADLGVFDSSGTIATVYDFGIALRAEDRFGIYFPLYESDNLANSFLPGTKYVQKIRFTLSLDGIKPAEIVQAVF
jgi:hypothetical protein